ncbi:MAG: serine hydrolase domain-containing protein [Burkholderiales bacterium]|nr:serine hydrolase domain-containing protein [Burkholderiales bacterium]
MPLRLTKLAAALLGTMTLTACVTPGTPASVDEAWKVKLDAELAAITASPTHTLASLSTLVIRDGKVVYEGQFGSRWIDPSGSGRHKPANRDTMYRAASISKLVTSLGVMKLVEEGKLDLDRDVSDYLGWSLRNPHFPNDRITLRMLMNHTSSLRDDGGYYWATPANIRDALEPGGKAYGKGADGGKSWSPRAKPGAFFQYANLPWGIIGTVMEKASGERFDRLMRRLILDPMQLKGGYHPYDFPPADIDNLATLYRKRSEVNGKEVWNPAGPWVAQVDDPTVPQRSRAGDDYVIGSNGTAFGPQGNIRLSAASLGRIMLMLMNGGESEGRRILAKSSVDAMLAESWRYRCDGCDGKPNGDPNGEQGFGKHALFFNAWGLGNQHFLDITGPAKGDRLVRDGGFTAVGHLGDAWGLTAAFVFNRDSRNGMIYLIGGPSFNPDTNPGTYSAFYRHEEQILDALYRRAIQQRLD